MLRNGGNTLLAVHFGAGNIGRAFIGELLSLSNYEICFVDINKKVISEINSLKRYSIELVGDNPKIINVKNVSAVNSNDEKTVTDAILRADIITTAVGPKVLKVIAPSIAAGLSKRILNKCTPINIIACENMEGATSILKKYVSTYLSAKELKQLPKYAGFPNAAVDRIVPLQKNDEKLLVQTEPFFEWDIDENALVTPKPIIKGVSYVKNLQAYIERKLFAVNATHAAIAYIGYINNIYYINQALADNGIRNVIEVLLRDAGLLLNKKYNFDLNEFKIFMKNILNRFSSKYIADAVTRVGRAPIRKLGPNDRLVSPAVQLEKRGYISAGYAKAIAAAFCFDYENDVEAVTLQQYIKENNIADALLNYTKIDPDSDLGRLILKNYDIIKKNND